MSYVIRCQTKYLPQKLINQGTSKVRAMGICAEVIPLTIGRY